MILTTISTITALSLILAYTAVRLHRAAQRRREDAVWRDDPCDGMAWTARHDEEDDF